MRRPLAVERLGQVNLFAQSLDAELNLQQDVFGARVLRRWGTGRRAAGMPWS